MTNVPVSALMTFPEVAGLVISICGVFVTVILFMQKSRNAMLEDKFKTIWKRVDENKMHIENTEKYVDRNFHNKDELREYIDLVNAPYLKQMEHINDKLDDLQCMVKGLVDTKKDN